MANIVPAPAEGLGGAYNYLLNSSCNNITGLQVSVDLTQDLVTSNGFAFQLNGYSPKNFTCSWQQYVIAVDPKGRVQCQINTWPSTLDNWLVNQWDDLFYLPNSTLPAKSNLLFALTYDNNNNVTGATFTVRNLMTPAPGSAINGYSGSDNSQHINFLGTDGHVHELYIHSGAGWTNNDLTAASGNSVPAQSGSPLAGYWASDNSQHVHYIGTDGHVHELYIYPGGGWLNNDLTVTSGAGVLPVAGRDLHSYWGPSTSQHVNFVGTDIHVHEIYINPGGRWAINDLTLAAKATIPPRLGAGLGGYTDANGAQHVHYLGTDGHVHELYINPGAGWATNDLTAASRAPVLAEANSPLCSYYGPNGSQHINYVGTDGHVHEIYANAGSGWGNNDLTLASGAKVLPGPSSALHGYSGTDGSQHVNYTGGDGHVHELYAHPGANWSDNDLTALSNGGVVPILGSPLDGYYQGDKSQHVNFLGTDGHLHELFLYPGGSWSTNDLSNIVLATKTQPTLSISGATAADLAPLSAFELNLVGHDSAQTTTLSSGAGTITYSATVQMTPLSAVPSTCTQESNPTGETSNSSYGTLLDAASQTITQSFSTGTTVMVLPKGLKTHSTPPPPSSH